MWQEAAKKKDIDLKNMKDEYLTQLEHERGNVEQWQEKDKLSAIKNRQTIEKMKMQMKHYKDELAKPKQPVSALKKVRFKSEPNDIV